MKMNRTFAFLAAALLLLPLSSCLKDQADIFEEPASTRMQNYLEDVRKILQEPAEGWTLSYYPGSAYPTCYMAVKFGPQQVTAYGQGKPEEGVTSSYKLTNDDGPVLSFDTYNAILHYYATSDAQHYQARGGDFEFEIVDKSDSRITLRGKRSRNLCYLDKLGKNAQDFLTEINVAEAALDIVAFEGTVSGGLVEGFIDNVSHTLSIGRKGAESTELTNARYMVVPGGFHFNEPFTFQGVTFSDFAYDAEAGTLTGSSIVFNKVIPEGYVPYQKYLGKWNFYWYDGDRSFPVELVAFEEGASFKMKGLSTYFEPVLGYNAARGQLTWNAQAVGSSGAITVMLAGWDLKTNGGSLDWDESLGVVGVVEDNTVDKLVVYWEDNGESDLVVDSWILWGVTESGSSAGIFSSWSMASGSYQLPYIHSMVKL